MAQFDAVQEGLIQSHEHGELHEDGQTAAHGVHAVGPVQLHHFALHGLLVVLILLLDLLHHGLELLHLLHGLEALAGERPEDDLDEDGQGDDGEAPVAHVGLHPFEELQHGDGDEAEDAEVDGGRKIIGSSGEQVAGLGTDPPAGLEFSGLAGFELHVLHFHSTAPHAAFVDAALEHGGAALFGEHGGEEVVAHETGPVDLAALHDALLGEVFHVAVVVELALDVPRHVHHVVVAFAAEVSGADAVAHAGGRVALGIDDGDLFIHEIGIGMEGDVALDAGAVEVAEEGEGGGAVLDLHVGAAEAPLAHIPGGLAVHEQAHGSHGSGGRGDHVVEVGAGNDGGVVLLQLEGLEHAAAGVEHGFVEGGIHAHFAAFGRHELGDGSDGLDFGGLGFFGRGGLLFSHSGHRGGFNPAHVFGEDLPAEHDGDSEDDRENEATVIHDVPESLLSQRDERWRGGAQDRIRPDCPGGSAGCAENRATGPLWGHVPR